MAGIREVQSGRGQDCCVRSRRRNSTAVLPACGLRRTPVIGVLTFVYPVVAIIIDWAIYGHPIGVAQGVGMVLIAVATLGVRLGWRLPVRRTRAAFAGQK